MMGKFRQNMYGGRAARWMPLLLVLVLSGCDLGSVRATPEPVNLPVYEQGASVAESAAITDTGGAQVAPAAPTPATAGATPASAAAEAPPAAAAPDTAASTIVADASAALMGSYVAEIAADDELVVVAQTNGQVLALTVEVGDRVQAGDLLVQLDDAALAAQRMQALAALKATQAQLEQVRTPAKQLDLEAARAALAAASAAYKRALAGPTAEELRQAQAQLQQAEAAVSVAQAGYNLVRSLPEVGALPQGLQLQQATLALEGARAQYEQITQGATQDQIAGAYAAVANAQAQLQRLEDGAKDAQIQAVTAQVHGAENALYLAQLQLDKATITAPIDGIVTRVQTALGALAAPGAPMVTLLSPTVKVTVDVEENLLGTLQVGQRAEIRVEAYPDATFSGEVSLIAPEVDSATRTVQVTIRPDDPQGRLRPGMSATARLFE